MPQNMNENRMNYVGDNRFSNIKRIIEQKKNCQIG